MTMSRRLMSGIGLALLLVASLAAGTLAQGPTDTPEGFDWHLATIAGEDGVETVPFGMDPTLRLEDGAATGSGGCNSFVGGYVLEGGSLTIGEDLAVTQAFCEGPSGEIEDAYLPLLGTVASWSIAGDALELANDAGETILVYELASIALTPSRFAALVATLADIQRRLDAVPTVDPAEVRALRQRVRTLEQQIAGSSSDDADDADGASGPDVSFTAAEEVLLEGIPMAIRRTCVPRREALPDGNIGAVQCDPADPVVRDMAYYLLGAGPAERVFEERMREHGVRSRPRTCMDGRASVTYSTGALEAEGCYVDGNGRANLRFIEPATACRVLEVGDRTIRRPQVYIAVLGEVDDIAALWASTNGGEGLDGTTGIWSFLRRPNAAISPACPS